MRSTVSPYYHYTDTDNRERARAKLTKQNKKKKKKADEVHRGRKKHKKKFKAAMRKWQMLAASKVKMSGSETKMERGNIYDFFSIKRATRTFHVLWSRAKQWQRNVQKNVLHVQTFFFALKPYWFFLHFSLPSPVSITRFLLIFFFWDTTLSKLTSQSCAFSPGVKIESAKRGKPARQS